MGIPELIKMGGFDSDMKGKITEAFSFNTESACAIASFFATTSRTGLDDGVYRGQVCDFVHGESICCGGEFGSNGERFLLQKDCVSLERTSWTNSTVDPLPEALNFPSSAKFNNGTDDLWLITGGESMTNFTLF